jgi:hypothetical protein
MVWWDLDGFTVAWTTSPSVTRTSGAGSRRPDVSVSKLQMSCSAPSGNRMRSLKKSSSNDRVGRWRNSVSGLPSCGCPSANATWLG